ncbi:hypothetical protein Pcinc_029783 [Petrolisthes cinctipes]|uniref:Uncharacterized protein n=1 Tax=Petrolisthes cinctipes TaxID=88211 RepID=A0AAE1F036_PETCI|nr:hypothetical protein Pcinc_029783 [Petrolisthes cinctipes]
MNTLLALSRISEGLLEILYSPGEQFLKRAMCTSFPFLDCHESTCWFHQDHISKNEMLAYLVHLYCRETR